MSKRKTKEEWQLESDIIHNCEFEILEIPDSGQHVVRVLHKKCGNIIETRLNNHLKRYCTYCSGKNRKSKNDWQILSDSIHNSSFSILEDVFSGKNKVKVLHKNCGNIISLTMNNHINHKNGCKLCSKYSLKSNEYWVNKVEEIWEGEYVLLEKVINITEKVKVKHMLCGGILLKSMKNLAHNKRGCEQCNRNFSKTDILYWQEKLDLLHGLNKYRILESPKNSTTKVNILHIKCGRIYKTTPSVIKLGCGCNICCLSKGELKISEILDEMYIGFETQKKFDDCLYIEKLSFDFYLPEYNTCIEFDGIQHFESVCHFGGDVAFEIGQIKDKIKNDFCENKTIKLIRISYKQIDKIKEILWEQLLKNKQSLK